jgi:hypothetical protein
VTASLYAATECGGGLMAWGEDDFVELAVTFAARDRGGHAAAGELRKCLADRVMGWGRPFDPDVWVEEWEAALRMVVDGASEMNVVVGRL